MALPSSEERKLQEKLSAAEKCPFHDVLPEIIGPRRLLSNFPENFKHSFNIWLLEEFPDALLFPDINWTCFCPECAKKSPAPYKHNAFGYGFCSQYSWQAALTNWNKACIRHCKRAVLRDLRECIEH